MAGSPELLPGQRASNCSRMSGSLLNGSGRARRGCVPSSLVVVSTWTVSGSSVLSGPFFGSVSVAGLRTHRPGTLRRWFQAKGFHDVRGCPWVWAHDFAGVTVNLACRVTKMSIEAHIGLCQHNVRQGWRAWIFQRWSNSGRHELRALPAVTPQVFRSLQFDDVRAWALSAAPAATVALGATFSPAHWSFVPSSGQSPSALCPWGCGELQHKDEHGGG